MNKYTPTIVEGEPRKHPATIAWRSTSSGGRVPTAIESLKRRGKKHAKSHVFRLFGAGPDGSSVIAKLCPRQTAQFEIDVYQRLLPALSVPCIRCLGDVTADDDKTWLFLEDASEEAYEPSRAQHRRAVSRWLATIHTAAAEVAVISRLPDRGPQFYLEHLSEAHRHLTDTLVCDRFCGDRFVLKTLVEQLVDIRDRWDRFENLSKHLPCTLVHGDFVEKNFRMRTYDGHTSPLVFDWEMAGRGFPGVDLAGRSGTDLRLYSDCVKSAWPHVTLEDVRRSFAVGRLFRFIAAVSWASCGLGDDPRPRTMRHIRDYSSSLAKILGEDFA